MKVAAFILTTVLSIGLMLGGAFVLIFTQDEPSPTALTVLVIAPIAFLIAGLFAGTFLLTSGRDPATPDGRRFFVRVALVLGLVVVAGVAALVTVALLGEVSLGFAVGWIAAGLVYVAANVLGAEYLRRRDIRLRPVLPPLAPLDAEYGRRRVRAAVWWFCGVLVAGTIAVVVLALSSGDVSALPWMVGLVVTFAALAAMFVCLTVVFRVNALVRELLGTDTARTKRIARVVLRGKDEALSDEEWELARRYAPLAVSNLSWSAAQFAFLYLSLFGQHAGRFLAEGTIDTLQTVLFVLIALGAVVAMPLILIQRQRVKRFAQRVAETAPSDTAPSRPTSPVTPRGSAGG